MSDAPTSDASVGGRLAAVLAAGEFAVTGEIVPPKGGSGASVTAHARELVGYVDAVNVTDNPTASAHMSPAAGARFVFEAGIEPTVQLTVRDRNRLAVTSELLGAWALGARNLFCLTGDRVGGGDHPDAMQVDDLSVEGLIGLVRRMRDHGTSLAGTGLVGPPRFLIGVADAPLAEPYLPEKLESKLDAGADFVVTQIAYDLERLAGWADTMRPRGLFERAKVLIGVTPLRSAAQARFMDEKLYGVSVPAGTIAALDAAGDDAPAVGMDLTTSLVEGIRRIEGVAGIHVMALGRDDATRELVERSGLFPRPTGAW
ncbi:MAG TPA: methylenetetrahydrofolate reductase [Actinomycetota bacterium]|nr:methylenetetrahydrofolate reductase [Actinomycetota bacterium]